MCGLVGALSSTLSPVELDVFRLMFHFDIVRGEDASGVFINGTKNGKREMLIAKTTGHPTNLYTRYPAVFSETGKINRDVFSTINMILGHNRSKTIGENTPENAHPFHYGDLVGFHNGTLTGLTELPELPKTATGVRTDSERFYHALATGMTIEDLVKKVNGAMALVWYNKATKELKMFRNKERPLYYYIATGTMYYASEAWMIELAINRAKTATSFVKTNLKELPEDTLLTFNTTSFIKQEGEGVVIKKPVTPVSSRYTGSAISDWRNTPTYLDGSKNEEVALLDNLYVDNSKMTDEEFHKAAKCGCTFCGDDVTWEQHKAGELLWIEADAPLCKKCVKQNVG